MPVRLYCPFGMAYGCKPWELQTQPSIFKFAHRKMEWSLGQSAPRVVIGKSSWSPWSAFPEQGLCQRRKVLRLAVTSQNFG